MAAGASLTLLGEVRLDVDDILAVQELYGAPGLPRPKVEDFKEVDIEAGNFG